MLHFCSNNLKKKDIRDNTCSGNAGWFNGRWSCSIVIPPAPPLIPKYYYKMINI